MFLYVKEVKTKIWVSDRKEKDRNNLSMCVSLSRTDVLKVTTFVLVFTPDYSGLLLPLFLMIHLFTSTLYVRVSTRVRDTRTLTQEWCVLHPVTTDGTANKFCPIFRCKIYFMEL